LSTNHFRWKIQFPKPKLSSFILTQPRRTICESIGRSCPRIGEPPIPEYGNAYEEPEGDGGGSLNEELYPRAARVELLPYVGAGSARLWGACGAGRDGVSDVP